MPTSAFAFIALVGLVGWAAMAGGAGYSAHAQPLPAVGPVPLATLATTPARSDRGLVGVAITDGLPPKSAAAVVRGRALPTATTLRASSSTVNDFAEASALAQDGIPITALRAYKQAAARERGLDPSCGLTWPLLAGIGRVESDHGRVGGAVLHADGRSTPPIIGIALNGKHGTALIRDTDNGRLDGDPVYDRAVGPMQFIPSTWASWGVDANHDGVADPFNIFDAAAAAADYLCAAGGSLTTYAGQVQAVRSYNDSNAYIALVLNMERIYASGVGVVVPVAPGTGASGPGTRPTLPPVNPGPPPGIGKGKHHRHHHPSRPPSSSAPRSPSRSPSTTPTTPSTPPSTSPSGSPSSSPSGSPSTSPSSSPSRSGSRSPSGCPSGSSSASSSPTRSASRSPSGCPSSSSSAPSSRSRSRSSSGSGSASG